MIRADGALEGPYLGVRLSVGVQLPVAKRLDVYGQVIPRFRFKNDSDFGVELGIGIRYQF